MLPRCVRAKKLLLRPTVGAIVAYALGVIKKKKRKGRPVDTLNPETWDGYFLTVLPVAPLREMWMLQVSLSSNESSAHAPAYAVYGTRTASVGFTG